MSPTIGQQIKLLKTPFSPEAIGTITEIRGYGTLQGIEARILPGQPGPRIRIAGIAQWEAINQAEGGVS